MLISPKHEIAVFVSAFLCGQAICVIFDIFRAIRRNFKSSSYTVNLHDVIFCLIAFFLLYKTFYISNSGLVRWYEPVTVIFSGIIYFLCESMFVLKFFTVAVSWITKPFCIIFKKICSLLRGVKNRVFKPLFSNIKSFSRKYIKKPCKTPKNGA